MWLSQPAMVTLVEPLPANQDRVPDNRAGQNGSLGCREQHTRRCQCQVSQQLLKLQCQYQKPWHLSCSTNTWVDRPPYVMLPNHIAATSSRVCVSMVKIQWVTDLDVNNHALLPKDHHFAMASVGSHTHCVMRGGCHQDRKGAQGGVKGGSIVHRLVALLTQWESSTALEHGATNQPRDVWRVHAAANCFRRARVQAVSSLNTYSILALCATV
jgi:hypothetical protein